MKIMSQKKYLSFSGTLNTEKIQHIISKNENFQELFEYVGIRIKKPTVSPHLNIIFEEIPLNEAKTSDKFKPFSESIKDPDIKKYYVDTFEKNKIEAPKENFKVTFKNSKCGESGEFGIYLNPEEKGNANFMNLWMALKENAPASF